MPVLVVASFGIFTNTATSAAAKSSRADTYQVTLAARRCPSYTDITANKARNNIMESLKDLGADTPYVGDEEVSASVEAAYQPNCTPIVGWHFTLGDGIAAPVTGPWGSLSTVSSPFVSPPSTKLSVPLLDANGDPTGQNIAGAVTVTLSAQQVQLAEQHQLWIQGGLVNDPVEDAAHPGTYGFGALRCALDNVNGDNVEWLGFRQGEHHVFCFAYYVVPPPTSGTIIIQKSVPAGVTSSESFNFTGNVSFNPGGAFSLDVVNGQSASQTFIRAASATPWTVAETVPVNWTLQSLRCVGTNTEDPSTFVYSGAQAAITLSAGDVVTCTYVDAPIPPAQLTIRKVSYGGVGTFPFTISQGNVLATVSATTTAEGVAVDAGTTGLTASGTYVIKELVPTATDGSWALTSAQCDGIDYPITDDSITIGVTLGTAPLCTFTDVFTPDGVVTIHKVMHGALGRAGFVVTGPALDDQLYLEAAPTEQGVPALAVGDATDHLPLGTYEIEEVTPSGQDPSNWALTDVTCSGERRTSRASVTVTLTASHPHVNCTFVDTYTEPTIPPSTTVPVAPPGPVTSSTIRVTG